jgi:ADP-ribose pyrophosphatase YjhB (NUDIX family)
MSALRLGVVTAVIESETILLSRRGDFGVWNLPSGRLDSNESIVSAAEREVREETGIICKVAQPIGLYYQHGRARMNVLFKAQPAGGALEQHTTETTANQYFPRTALPVPLFGDFMVQHAFESGIHLHQLVTPAHELRRIKRKLALRWVRNLLAGHPEPRWARFEVQASLAVLDQSALTVLALEHNGTRVLPGCVVNGDSPIWEQVSRMVRDRYGVYELRQLSPRWVGMYQNVNHNRFEFVFLAEFTPHSSVNVPGVHWTPIDSERWHTGYARMMRQILARQDQVVMVIE